MFVDTHAHLTSPSCLEQVDSMLESARKAGIEHIVNICTDVASLEAGLLLAKRYKWVYNVAATTPHDVDKEGESFFPIVEATARAGQLVALGETGLDYYYEHSNRRCQQEFLMRYCALAKTLKLPLIFHCREAFSDLFSITDVHAAGVSCVLHCFTGQLEDARGVLDRGWMLSASGIVTFKKSQELREVVKFVPLDRLLIETDTPYLAPQSHRGQPNQPAYLTETAQVVAELKGIPLEELARITTENAQKFFSFSKVERDV